MQNDVGENIDRSINEELGDGCLQYDEELKCYHVGNVILPQANELSGMVGEKINVLSIRPNDATYLKKLMKDEGKVTKLLKKYPLYAKFKK